MAFPELAVQVLLFCHKPPFPPVDGGTVAELEMVRTLRDAGFSITVASLATEKHPASAPAPVADVEFLHFPIDTKPRFGHALGNLHREEPYATQRFLDRGAVDWLQGLLTGNFDIVQFEGIGTAPYLDTVRSHSDAVLSWRAHNVEADLWRDRAAMNSFGPRRWYCNLQARKMGRLEQRVWAACDGIIAISDPTAAACRKRVETPVITIPVAIESRDNRQPTANCGDAVHLASMDWPANRDAVRWLLEAIWPRVLASRPQSVLRLAGRGEPPRPLKDGIHWDGWVDSAEDYLASHGPMLVPLRFGSGLRVKIVQAMALGKAIVTTSLGADGIGGEPGTHYRVADSPSAFAQAVVDLLEEPERAVELGQAAQTFARDRFDRRRMGIHLSDFYRQLTAA